MPHLHRHKPFNRKLDSSMAKNAFKSRATPNVREKRREMRAAKRRGNSNIIDLAPSIAAHHPVQNQGASTRPMEYFTEAQKTYHQMIKSHTLTFGIGPAGCGKSHVAVDHAALMLLEKRISKIIICRPAVESGRGLGFLPGEIEDKWAPYFRPIKKILNKRLGASHVENLMKSGAIEIAPLEFLRGDTFENAFVLLDEAQNATQKEFLTFLTRIGKFCTVVVDGDLEQIDIKEPSGLPDALERLSGMRDYATFEFTENDIVRHDLIREIIIRYRRKI